jgi:hypothetical protein
MRSEIRRDSRLFGEAVRTLLRDGFAVRFRASGRSMYPAVQDGDEIQVEAGSPRRGEVGLAESREGWRLHRLTKGGQTRGDCCLEDDSVANVMGKISLVNGGSVPRQRMGSKLRRWLARWRGRF